MEHSPSDRRRGRSRSSVCRTLSFEGQGKLSWSHLLYLRLKRVSRKLSLPDEHSPIFKKLLLRLTTHAYISSSWTRVTSPLFWDLSNASSRNMTRSTVLSTMPASCNPLTCTLPVSTSPTHLQRRTRRWTLTLAESSTSPFVFFRKSGSGEGLS